MKGDDVSHILTPTFAVFGTVLGFVVLAVCVCKCSKKSNKRDPFHNSSMCNRTYDRQMPKHDEEYAIISEIELDSGTTFYKPSLPERGNDSSGNTYHTIEHGRDVSNTAVITLDEYSTPSDMITDKCKADPADEYKTTYDDPIRHNLQNTAECKRKSETKDANGNLAQESDNIRDKSFRDSRDGENEISESYEYIIDTKKETSVNEESLNTVKEQGKEAENDKFFESEESHAVECNFSTPARSVIGATGGNFECFIPTVLEGHSSSAEDKDYEDTNIIDGNFPSRPKDIFEEHVCLHCLKPEHLKRLGIKIIPDKPLEDVERRLSEPQRKTNYSATETDRTLRRCLTDVSRKDRQNDLIDFVENTDQDENFRECIVCNNVYDRMGRIREKLDTKNDVNEYDHLSNWKHISEEKTLMENS
ncbi:uncharacterized protein LOC128559867 [Mercenaria mercenaria]|uniref:uncharacterized protein LOC128559867 n=1 Tax=Mercenaria mercenaria TaxID=6596 RepID=UPI00234E5510|nr:uncharacterized protein LOC128559867 [Mercenaria mercenaria]